MLLPKLKKPHITLGVTAMVLSGIFAGIVVGPVFLYANEYQPPNQPPSLIIDSPDAPNIYGEEAPNVRYDPLSQPTPPGDYTTGSGGTLQPDQSAAEAAARRAEERRKEQAEALAAKFSCNILKFWNPKPCVAALMDIVMWIAARTLWIAGVLFNITLHYTLNLNTLLQRLPIVDIGWKVLRDIANIVFIFITLWCGISITLGIGDGGKKAWGYLAQMVLVALFINFSLFITKAVVDASNIAALHFYSLIVEPGHEDDYDSGLSEAFMYGLKLGTLYNSEQLGAGGAIGADQSMITGVLGGPESSRLSMTNIILIGFFGTLFIITAAWVFFAATIMFIYRAVTLIFLMILSPLAFVGLILPGASGMAHSWWSKLWSQAFFAPLYLALAYVVVRTINSTAFQGAYAAGALADGVGFAGALTGTGANTVAIIFNFVILIGFMVACLVVAQSLGAKGSEMAMAGWEKIKGGAYGVAGATARGIIKLPSGGIQAVGNVGKAGQWMANTRLLNNKLMDRFFAGGKGFRETGLAKRASELGTRFHEGKFMSRVRKGTSKARFFDPRYLEERAGQSWLGQTAVGKAVRSVTTGAVAHAKIGGKSLEEAYQEGEEMSSRRQEIGYGHTARQNANALEPLHENEQELLNEKLAKETQQKIAEEKLKEAQTSKDPAKIAAAEKALGTGFLKASEALTAAEKNLEKIDKTKDPAGFAAAEAALVAAKKTVETERAKGGAAVERAKAEKDIEDFEAENRKNMEQHTNAIRVALAKMSTEAFLELPKTFFENPAFMDPTVLGEDKHLALMKSEHFTREEKEEYTKARWKRAKDTAVRRKTRSESFLAEMPEYQKKVEAQKKARKEVADELKAEIESGPLKDDIEKADFAITQAEHAVAEHAKAIEKAAATGTLPEKKLAEMQLSTATKALEIAKKNRTDLEQKVNDKREAIEATKIDAATGEAILRNAKGEEIKHEAPKQPGWDEAPDIRKALRNILRPDEVINLYRYDREAFGNPFIADTIKQSTWNEVRRSGQVDSNSIEQIARVQKRHYIKDSLYFGSGLDPVEMHKLEAENLSEAYGLLNELGDEMKTLGIEGYRKWIESGGLQKFLQDKGLHKRLSADIKVQLERHDAGLGMYKMTAPNLATNEFEMMPGMLREHPISLNYYDQASITPFTHRDIENTLPIAEFYIEQFKRDVEEGGGVISEGNLRILKWFVNENQGQSFTQFEMVREDLKDWFEMIKRLIGKSNRAMTTNKYATPNDVYADMQRRTGKPAHDPFERIRSKTDKPS